MGGVGKLGTKLPLTILPCITTKEPKPWKVAVGHDGTGLLLMITGGNGSLITPVTVPVGVIELDEIVRLDDLIEDDEAIEELSKLEDVINDEDITDDDTTVTEDDDELDETTGGGLNTVVTLISTPQPGILITPVELPKVESRGIV